MSRLPFPNYTNQQFGHEKPPQNHLVQRQLWSEVGQHQGMLPPRQSEFYTSSQQPPPPPTWVPPPQALHRLPPQTLHRLPPQALEQPPPPWIPPPQVPPPVWPQPHQAPPLPPMMVPPPPPTQTQLYPSVGTLASDYQTTNCDQDQQQYSVTSVDECGKLSDQDWANKWINEIISVKKKEIQETPSNDIKLHQMKEKLSAVLQCIKELENSSRVMGLMVKTVDEIEWSRKCKEVENKKTELYKHLKDLESAPELLASVQEKVTKRRKKREYLKRRAMRWKKAKQERLEKRKMLHKQIDLWLNEMEEDVERTRREEELKQQADAVLSTVMQKKAEARKQIALLTGLLQLRQSRVTAMLGTGRTVSQTQISTFNEVIEKLKAMWIKQMDEYLLEEQGLRVMLGESEVYKTFSVESQEKQIYRQWEEAIFGLDSASKGEPFDRDEFIERRREWDQFVVNERTVVASSIPIGWVLPVPPSDDMWRRQLKSSK